MSTADMADMDSSSPMGSARKVGRPAKVAKVSRSESVENQDVTQALATGKDDPKTVGVFDAALTVTGKVRDRAIEEGA